MDIEPENAPSQCFDPSPRDGIAAQRCVVLGAGPAGLTAAWEAARRGLEAVVFEKDELVGGISRTVEHRGFRFDIGGHRFFTKVPSVRALWHELLGDELITRDRLSRIYYGDHFFDYPLRPWSAVRGLGPIEAVRVALSYLVTRAFPYPEERTFEEWVVNRFGRRLFEIFFETYTEKVWGTPCSEISSDWAAQRIKNLDMVAAVKNALLGLGSRRGEVVTSLIERFEYPRLGPGMMWERCRDRLAEKQVSTRTGHEVVKVMHDGSRIEAVSVRGPAGEELVGGDQFLSSIALRDLLHAMEPRPPQPILDAADRLGYRDFLTVVLIVDREDVFPDNWIYIHSPDVQVGRVQNFKNWSPEMVPDTSCTALGLEYFVQEDDELWSADDETLIALGTRECVAIGLIEASEVSGGTVVRVPKAYPVYDPGYRENLDVLRGWLDGFDNLHCIGRNGQHRYNNQDHSMLTAMLAVQNIAGESHDIWNVNVEADYHEEIGSEEAGRASHGGDPAVPQRAEVGLEEALRGAFARYDEVALGVAIGAVLGISLFLATAVLLLRGGEVVGPTLSIVGNFFFGFQVTWAGALVGLAEGAVGGFAFGFVLARLINAVVRWHERRLLREIERSLGTDVLEIGESP
jgi:protoporphyrinogen oxidase